MLSLREVLKLPGVYAEAVHAGINVVGHYLSDQFIKSNIPDGRGQPIVFIPGYTAGDFSLSRTRTVFEENGYASYPWELGSNVFFTQEKAEKLVDYIAEIAEKHDEKVFLVGQSMGGVVSRELARKHPDLIAGYVSLGSPFAAVEGGAGKLTRDVYRGFNPEAADFSHEDIHDAVMRVPEVKGLHIYSKKDRICDWHVCRDPHGENLEVRSAHCGMAFDPKVLVNSAQFLHYLTGHLHEDVSCEKRPTQVVSRTATPASG